MKDKLPMVGCEVCWACGYFNHSNYLNYGVTGCEWFRVSIVSDPTKTSCIWWNDEEDTKSA